MDGRRSTTGGRPSGTRRATAAIALAVVVGALTACEPPAPDGRDLGISTTGAPGPLIVGEATTFTVTVTNHGTAAASGSSVGILAPTGLQALATGPAGPCDRGPADERRDLVGCPTGDLGAGQTVTIEVTLHALTEVTDAQLIVAARSDGSEPATDPHANRLDLPLSAEAPDEVDLHLVASRAPAPTFGATAFTSIATVANRGHVAATPVTVTQTLVATVPVVQATLTRTDGGASGACTLAPGVITCTTGADPIEPLDDPGDRWEMRVVLAPTSGAAFFIDLAATSPQAEAQPDLWPGSTRVTSSREPASTIVFGPLQRVAVGSEFTVPATWVTGDVRYAQYLSASVPEGFELRSVSTSGTTYPCVGTGSVSCSLPFFPTDGSLSFAFRALAPTDPVTVGLSFTSELGGAGGSALLQAYDPTVTSDIHPDVTEPSGGVVGGPTVTTGVIRTSGSAAHDDVEVRVAPGAGMVVVGVQWGEHLVPCPVLDGAATCSLGPVAGHSVVPLRLVLVPTAPGDREVEVAVTSATAQDVPDPRPDTQRLSIPTVARTVDLGVTLRSLPSTPTVGVPTTFTVDATNHGSTTAPGTELTISVPASLPVTAVTAQAPHSAGSGGCSRAGNEITCELGDLVAGRTQTVTVTTSAPSDTAGGTLSLLVSSAASESDPDPNPNALVQSLSIAPPNADLEVVLSEVPASVVAGEARTYEGRVINHGPSAVDDAVAVVELPAGWILTAASASPEPCAIDGTTATCALASMHGNGGNRRIRVEAHPTTAAPNATITASVSTTVADLGPRPNTASRSFAVLAQEVDLGLATTSPAEVAAGAEEVFSLDLTNAGPARATDVVLTATFPASVEVVRVRSILSGMPCTIDGSTVTCTAASLVPRVLDFTLVHRSLVSPVTYDFTVTSALPEVTDQVGANSLSVTRTVVPGPATARVWTEDRLGNGVRATVNLYRSTDGDTPSYTATATTQDSWAEFPNLPAGEYRVELVHPNYATTWWDGVTTRSLATPLVAVGLSERFDLRATILSRP